MSTESRKKLASVRYHLTNLRDAHSRSDEVAIRAELSALQNASYSVMQRMLYDAAVAFGLEVTPADHLHARRFESLAEQQSNAKAIDFLDWWKKKVDELDRNPAYELRDMDTHKGDPTLNQVPTAVYVSGFSSIEVSDPRYVASYVASRNSGRIYTWGPSQSVLQNAEIKNQYQIEGSSAAVTEDCAKLSERLETLVGEAEAAFRDQLTQQNQQGQ